MARAKHTGRAEARRRYRRAGSLSEDGADTEVVDSAPEARAGSARSTTRPNATPSGRPSFLAAFRGAYHPAHFREDLGHLPRLLRSRALLAALGLVLLGAASAIAFPGYTGSAFAWELLVLPGSALAPQLVVGFFAPRASYLLGFIVGLVQGLVFTLFLTQFAARLGTTLESDQVGNLLTLSFVTGPLSGTLFAAAAAWYRRFLAMSSPRRAPAGKGSSGRASAKGNPAKRAAGR